MIERIDLRIQFFPQNHPETSFLSSSLRIVSEGVLTDPLNKHQSLVDAVFAAVKEGKAGEPDQTEIARMVELAGRGLGAPETMSLEDIRALCRSVIANAARDRSI